MIVHTIDSQFWEAFKAACPNITVDVQNIAYNDLLDKFRTALLGNAGPMVVRLQILGGVEFGAKGYLQPLKPEDVGYKTTDFWPGAIKGQARDCGLRPCRQAERRQHALPLHARSLGLWRRGFGRKHRNPTYKTVGLNSAGTKAALQAAYDMYVRDKSVPVSALTNTQAENQSPFIAGQLAMMIAHPSEYAKMVDLASKATGADKAVADEVVASMRYGLIPKGPDRRAVVFGGSNIHVVKNEYVDGGLDEAAAKALIYMWTSPEWSTKLAGVSSNPGNLRGFQTEWMKERLDTIKFLDVTTSMLPNDIPFPVIPEAPEIMNIIVPDMLQNALTGKMTVDEAAEDAAKKVQALAGRHVTEDRTGGAVAGSFAKGA